MERCLDCHKVRPRCVNIFTGHSPSPQAASTLQRLPVQLSPAGLEQGVLGGGGCTPSPAARVSPSAASVHRVTIPGHFTRPFRGRDCAVSHCHLRRAGKLVVMELENHNPFSSCFSLNNPAPFTVERGERVYFLKANIPLDRLHGVKSWLVRSVCACGMC